MSFAKSASGKRANSYQSLEQRCLLAGNVTVFENVNLYIRGDQMDNQFEVVSQEDQLVINGLNGTTINGKESYLVKTATDSGSGITFEGGLRAHLGPGSDDFEIRDAQFESLSIVYGGTGDDSIDVVDSTFLDTASIQTYDGRDSVTTTRSHFEGNFLAMTLNGRDEVTMVETIFDGNSIVVTGEHKDSIHSEGSHYMGEVNLLLPLNGDDSVQLNNPVVGENQLGVFLGNGDDSISGNMMEAEVEGTITISGQGGSDETGAMTMNDEVKDKTVIRSIEKDELVFESGLGGIANVEEGASSYATTFEPGGERESTYIEQYATSVALETTETITQVEWSGSYVRDYFSNVVHGEPLADLGDSFFIEIFEDAGDGAPDADTVVRFELGDVDRAEAGQYEAVYYGEIPVYSYYAEIDFTMEAGKQYWVSIFTELDAEEYEFQNHWQWGLGINADAVSTAFNQGSDSHKNDWRRYPDNPYILDGFEMDLRLRA